MPALWSPRVAGLLSLLFSVAFGAYLQARNWQALGAPDKAVAAMRWVYAMATLFVLSLIMPPFLYGLLGLDLAFLTRLFPLSVTDGFVLWLPVPPFFGWLGLGLLLAWFISSARAQIECVKHRYGTGYPRKSWLGPVTAGITLIIVALAMVMLARHLTFFLFDLGSGLTR
ncbi:hypothetical protein CKO27_22050 [Thiocystis violacea]|nr:hypothetical protein [Thiocystis violacea]